MELRKDAIHKSGIVSLFLVLLFAGLPSVQAEEISRPTIWVKPADRAKILEKIETQPWAASLYTGLKQRVEPVASDSVDGRKGLVSQLPLIWPKGRSEAPVFPAFKVVGGATKAQWDSLSKALIDGIDCGVLYYLTQERKYGMCGADVLHNVVSALEQMPVDMTLSEGKASKNKGWLFPTDHLFEARGVGAQLPIIYDFIYPFISQGEKVYSLRSDSLVEFNHAGAQKVFETYAWLALNTGSPKNNWTLMESPSLVHNALALDDVKATQKYLANITHVDTKGQASLKTIAEAFKNKGDIWPESLQYSMRVAELSVYLMTLLERYDNNLALGQKYPNILAAHQAYQTLQFPNGDYPFLGDGDRSYDINYPMLEMSRTLSKASGHQELFDYYDTLLSNSAKAGLYDKAKLEERFYGGRLYSTPLQLLWQEPTSSKALAKEQALPKPRTTQLDYARLSLQRNENFKNPKKNSLMGFVGGATYVHAHATGMEMELYGQGHVLGIDGGKGTYKTNLHENYYRLFAAHNTVISNGASATEKRWNELGIKPVKQEAMEPLPYQQAVSPNHSFSISSFWDKFNLVAQAEHERTLALVKVSDTQGYYVDIFRAKARKRKFGTYGAQFHDYVYHNLGDSVSITSLGQPVPLKQDGERYKSSEDLPWVKQRSYVHPGWHFFKDVASTEASSRQHEMTFTASKLGKQPIYMRAISPGRVDLEVTQATAPPSVGAAAPYDKEPVPLFVLRKQGEAWNNPFAVVYESSTGDEGFAVKSVERLQDKRGFKGLKIKVETQGKNLTQYILLQKKVGNNYVNKKEGISFKGRFAIISVDDKTQSGELYIGQGSELKFKSHHLSASKQKGASMASYTTFEGDMKAVAITTPEAPENQPMATVALEMKRAG